MSPVTSSASIDANISCILAEDVSNIKKQCWNDFDDLGLECHPFKLKWYNDIVGPDYALDYLDDTLAFLVISTPNMFEKAFLPFLKGFIGSEFESDPIDKCMQQCFDLLKKNLEKVSGSTIDKIHDFELIMPYRKPKILLQTAAHISGAAYFYKQRNQSKHRLGVCIHPQFGGWFGIRGVFIFKQLLVPNMTQKLPLNVVPEDKQNELLEMFNERWKDSSYRDIITVKCRYSQLQLEYFALLPRDRIQFIKSAIFPRLLPQSLEM